jgi:hypothetical protein
MNSSTLRQLNEIWCSWLENINAHLCTATAIWTAPNGMEKEAAKHLNYFYQTGAILLSKTFLKNTRKQQQLDELKNAISLVQANKQTKINGQKNNSNTNTNPNTNSSSSSAFLFLFPPSTEEYIRSSSHVINPTLLPPTLTESKQRFLFARDPYSALLNKLHGNLFTQGMEQWSKYMNAIHNITNYKQKQGKGIIIYTDNKFIQIPTFLFNICLFVCFCVFSFFQVCFVSCFVVWIHLNFYIHVLVYMIAYYYIICQNMLDYMESYYKQEKNW